MLQLRKNFSVILKFSRRYFAEFVRYARILFLVHIPPLTLVGLAVLIAPDSLPSETEALQSLHQSLVRMTATLLTLWYIGRLLFDLWLEEEQKIDLGYWVVSFFYACIAGLVHY